MTSVEQKSNGAANTIEQEGSMGMGNDELYDNYNKFKTISNTQYIEKQDGQASWRDGSGDREINSQLEKHRYSKRNPSKKYRKFGNKTIQNGSLDGVTMSPYVPATSVYGNNPANRRHNRHFFGMGNNLIVAPYGVDPNKYYPPSGGDSMNQTNNSFAKSKGKFADPNSGPHKQRYDEKSNGTAENRFRSQAPGEALKPDVLDHKNA